MPIKKNTNFSNHDEVLPSAINKSGGQGTPSVHSAIASLEFNQFCVEVAADEVFWMQSDSRIVYVNKSACEKLEYNRDELIGMHVWEWDPLFPKEVWPAFWEDFKNKKSMQFETQHQSKSGKVFDVEITAHHYCYQNEEYLIAYVTDITDRKAKEAELNRYKNELEELVAKRTAALEVAKNEAQNSAAAKSQFLANMSHEIRTPMNGVMGMANALLNTELNEAQKGQALAIRSCSKTLRVIIDDILDISKIESGKLEIDHVAFNLDQLLQRIYDSVIFLVQDKGLELSFPDTANAAGCFYGDPVRIQQIITNFIGNAIKFTTQGTIQLQVNVSSFGDGKSKLYFEVVDKGIGIAEQDLAKLFTAFNQVDNSNTRQYGGTGLGLSICKLLVELMGGDIGCKSELGKGSKFWFTLTLDQCEKTPEEAGMDAQLDYTFNHVRALLVEDNKVNQEVARFSFEDFSITHLDIASDGQQAVELCENNHYDIIFMDCQMPIMDGYEATQKIRTLESFKTLPIIALTANAMYGEKEKCIAVGMTDLLTKPYDDTDLARVLMQYLPEFAQKAE